LKKELAPKVNKEKVVEKKRAVKVKEKQVAKV
jgi:hypothetical protein